MFNCGNSPACVTAIFSNPAEPAWLSGGSASYTNALLNAGSWAYQLVAKPVWVVEDVTGSYVNFSGVRPGSAAFTIQYQIISCGATTTYTLDYPGPSTVCVQCLFELQGT